MSPLGLATVVCWSQVGYPPEEASRIEQRSVIPGSATGRFATFDPPEFFSESIGKEAVGVIDFATRGQRHRDHFTIIPRGCPLVVRERVAGAIRQINRTNDIECSGVFAVVALTSEPPVGTVVVDDVGMLYLLPGKTHPEVDGVQSVKEL